MIDYVPIGLQLAIAAVMAFVFLGISTILGKPARSRTDLSPYECGVEPFEPAGKRYTVRFYMVAMLFILFDIEAAFLYPWATIFRDGGMEAFVQMAIFVAVLLVGFVYCWRRGALDWD
ncbi:MAG: NADH-quinone oxidoreductase subunit A [Candidatus Polarisedimenticolia bacterium]